MKSFSQPEFPGAAVNRSPRRVIRRVSVHVARDGDRRMPQQIGHRLDVNTRLKPAHGCGVPQRVDPDILDADRPSRRLQHAQQVARIDRPAQCSGVKVAA